MASPHPMLSPEQEAELRSKWEDGASLKELAAEYGVSQQTVRRTCFDRGEVGRRPRRYRAGKCRTPEQRARIAEGARRSWAERRERAGQ